MQSCRQPAWSGPTATEMLRRPPYNISNAYPVHVGQYGSDKSSQLSWSSLVCFLFLHRRKSLSRPATASGEPPSVHARFFCPSALIKVVVANKNLRFSIGRAWPLACDVRRAGVVVQAWPDGMSPRSAEGIFSTGESLRLYGVTVFEWHPPSPVAGGVSPV